RSLSRVSPYGETVPAENDEQPVSEDDESASIDGALVATKAPAAPDQDARVLAAATDWLGGLGSALMGWVGNAPPPAGETTSDAADDPQSATAEPIALARDDVRPVERGAEREHVEHADLATPLGLGVLSVLAIRVRGPVGRWIGRRCGKTGRRV